MKNRVTITGNYEEMSEKAADLIVDTVRSKPGALLCFAAGDTPRRSLQLAVARLRESGLDKTPFYLAGLDEWVGIPPSNTGSCQFFFRQEWMEPLNLSSDKYHFFDACSPRLDEECSSMDEWIRARGGIDLMMVGVGMNAHIGFNEPGTDWNLLSHVAKLDETTRSVGQKYFQEQTDVSYGISLGLGWMKQSKQVLLIANGNRKAEVVRSLLHDEPDVQIPASIVQTLPQAEIILDREAASRLQQNGVHEME
jgi:glucosamine-6-phosphate isomerase